MKKYLVLGSSGQVGSALTEYIEQLGHEALRFDIVHSTDHDLRIYNNPHLEKAIKEADYVFFLAFDVGGSRYLKKYQETHDFISNNTKLMNTTFDMLKKHNKKFIFASSQMSNMGHSNYGHLKAIGEAYTRVLGGIVVKFWNVYGVEKDHDKAHVITDLIKKAKETGKIPLLTDGTEERQFLYSEDCSECLVTLAENDESIPRDQELHITNFEWTKIIDIAKIISKYFNNAEIQPAVAKDDVQKGKRNEPNPFILNYWKPKTSIEDGILKVIKQMDIQVSTITPCFRMKKYLKKFLEELPLQTMFNEMEVILDHNEPDDEEIAWVQEFQAKYPGRLKHIIVRPVEPIGTSMNRCIREAAGEFVTIWNVDDLRTPDSIELQVKKLRRDNRVGIVYGDYAVVREFGRHDGKIVAGTYPDSELTRSMVIGPFFMFRKSLVEKAGYFDEQLKSGADFDLAIRLAFHAKAARADGLLGYYLNEGLGASTRPNSQQALDRTTIELRYGIYDKIDYDLVPASEKQHAIGSIIQNGEVIPVADLVPGYEKMISERRNAWKKKGERSHKLKKAFFIKQIKAKLKPILKPIALKLKLK